MSNESNNTYGIDPRYRDDPAPLMRLFVAFFDLKCAGWREIMYAPKDGREIEVIECGSTGIHRAQWHAFDKQEDPPDWVSDGCFFIDGNWPSHPILFREIAE